jgi:hypothetical protein
MSLSGRQVNDITEEWTRSLGVRCDACHAEATEIIAADDDSNLNYADDFKQMKIIARNMYGMTEAINSVHIAKIEGSGMRVTCGTCHRGHISPEPFVAPTHDGPTSRDPGNRGFLPCPKKHLKSRPKRPCRHLAE